MVHVLLLVEDLLHGPAEVGPQVGVGAVRVCNALLERPVCVNPALLHFSVLSVQDVINIGPQPLRS